MNEALNTTIPENWPQRADAAPAPRPAQLYLLVNNESHGPYSLAEVSARVRRGEIPAETLCAAPGSDAWVRVGDVVPPSVRVAAPRWSMSLSTVVSLIFITCAVVWWMGMENPGFFSGSALIVAFVIGYMFPTIVAQSHHHRNVTAIGVLNLLLGWTALGWIIAIVWACTNQERQQ